jgi:hypothetical protein
VAVGADVAAPVLAAVVCWGTGVAAPVQAASATAEMATRTERTPNRVMTPSTCGHAPARVGCGTWRQSGGAVKRLSNSGRVDDADLSGDEREDVLWRTAARVFRLEV